MSHFYCPNRTKVRVICTTLHAYAYKRIYYMVLYIHNAYLLLYYRICTQHTVQNIVRTGVHNIYKWENMKLATWFPIPQGINYNFERIIVMLVYKLKTCRLNSSTNQPIAVSNIKIQDSKGGRKKTSLSQKKK